MIVNTTYFLCIIDKSSLYSISCNLYKRRKKYLVARYDLGITLENACFSELSPFYPQALHTVIHANALYEKSGDSFRKAAQKNALSAISLNSQCAGIASLHMRLFSYWLYISLILIIKADAFLWITR